MSDVQQAAAPAAGWYPDPAREGASRWWSGVAWTDHVQATVPSPGMTVDAPMAPATTPAVHTGDRSQSDWHAQPALGVTLHRGGAGSVSLSVRAPRTGSRRHDPYGRRNWSAGLALALALLSIPALGWRAAADLPPLTQSIFVGAPIAVAVLALVLALRRGSGLVLSIVSIAISGAVLLAGLLVEPAVLRGIVDGVLGLLPL